MQILENRYNNQQTSRDSKNISFIVNRKSNGYFHIFFYTKLEFSYWSLGFWKWLRMPVWNKIFKLSCMFWGPVTYQTFNSDVSPCKISHESSIVCSSELNIIRGANLSLFTKYLWSMMFSKFFVESKQLFASCSKIGREWSFWPYF